MCSIRAAKAFGMDHLIGSLEKGKKADVIIVNTQQPHLAPFGIMPVQRLVYHAQGQDVDTVIVDGEVMMENRKMLLCDEKQILKDAEKAFEELSVRVGEKKMKAFLSFEGLYDIVATEIPNPYEKS